MGCQLCSKSLPLLSNPSSSEGSTAGRNGLVRSYPLDGEIVGKLSSMGVAVYTTSNKEWSEAEEILVSDQEIQTFFERAVTADGADVEGPRWSGLLLPKHLAAVAQELHIHDLGEEELLRVFNIAKAVVKEDNNVGNENSIGLTFPEFREAVRSRTGACRLIFRAFIWRLRVQDCQGFHVPNDYDWEKSTNDNYKADHMEFFGKFAELRKGRQYDYHVNYTKERQEWQDRAIKSVITRVPRKDNCAPWLVYTCGPMGVGKGYALSWMSKHGFFPLEHIVHVDPDAFKLMMPEWPRYVEKNRESAGTMCHRESGFMMEIAQAAAMQRHQNIWVDGSLRDADYYKKEFEDIRTRFPHYRISIFYVDADEDTIRGRVKERARKTGRDIPEHLLSDSLRAMDKSLNVLTPLCNFVARINNSGSTPVLTAFESIDTSGCWSEIKERFAQIPGFANDFPKFLAPLPLQRLPQDSAVMLTPSTNDGNLVLSLDLGKGADPVHQRLREVLPREPQLHISPRCKITLSDFARKLAHIPRDADSFVWVYPHPCCSEEPPRKEEVLESNVVGTDTQWDAERSAQVLGPPTLMRSQLRELGFSRRDVKDPLVQLLWEGGFCYLNAEGGLTAVNVICAEREMFCIQFGEPRSLPTVVADAIPSSRFREVTRLYLRQRGARSFAWILPGEMFAEVDVGGLHGAFVYDMAGDEPGKLRFPVVQD